jgi:hypothetical protein
MSNNEVIIYFFGAIATLVFSCLMLKDQIRKWF